MQPVQISLNPDLKRLEDEGFELEICGAHLLVHHIPYVTASRAVKYGSFVCILTLATAIRIGP
ncbi:MAG: UBA/THIF-type binding protein, partial [Chitinophagaceae bacterium]|nr:UBA/THIF-type binding protein [Chitinophagaceae bacterium]